MCSTYSMSFSGSELGAGFTFLLLVTLLVPAEGLCVGNVEHGLGQYVHLLQRHRHRSTWDRTEEGKQGQKPRNNCSSPRRSPSPSSGSCQPTDSPSLASEVPRFSWWIGSTGKRLTQSAHEKNSSADWPHGSAPSFKHYLNSSHWWLSPCTVHLCWCWVTAQRRFGPFLSQLV